MIYFYDTAALLKLFIQEEHSEVIRAQTAKAISAVVSEITWVEMHSALGRRIRQGESQEDVALAALEAFKSKWTDYIVISPSFEILQSAAQHAQVLGLRAYDSVQLASARQAAHAVKGDFVFCTFDKQLNNAARVLGIKVLDF